MARRLTFDFLKTETAAGAGLAAAALAGLVAANSPWSHAYAAAVHAPITVTLGRWSETLATLDWIKEGLMALFFFVVGLEIKYEAVKGELSSPRRLALPAIAALGGMAAPAAVYLLFNAGAQGARRGWPIPAATDIAFALAALALVGRRAPPALRTFLLALAIADDLGAVGLIAVLYSKHLHLRALAEACVALGGMALLSRWRRAPATLYVAVGAVLWALTLRSGVSPSVAAVGAAFTVPIRPRQEGEQGVLARVQSALQPYVSWGVLPLFAFAATGFPFAAMTLREAVGAVPTGVALGLLVGKPAGVLGAAALAARLGIARRPTGVSWRDMTAAAALCGVGFTMSLYLSSLAFGEGPQAAGAKLGVLVGSLASAALGLALLSRKPLPSAGRRGRGDGRASPPDQ